MRKNVFIILSIISALSVAEAQVIGGSTFFDQIASDWHMGFTVDTMGSAALPADLDDSSGGDLGVYSAAASIKFQGEKNKVDFLDLETGFEYRQYDFSSKNAPFRSMQLVYGRAFYTHMFNRQWSAFALCIGNFGAESSASLADGGRILAGLGAGYAFNENLRIGLGAAAVSRLECDMIPIPIGFIDWKITDRLSLRTFSGGALVYDFFGDGTLLVNFSCEYVNSEFRLTKYKGLGRSVQDSYMSVALGATYNITPNFYVSGSIGGNFFRELEFRMDGVGQGDIDIDSAPVFYIHIGAKF